MQVTLRTSAKRWAAAAAVVTVAAGYCAVAGSRLAADHLAQSSDEKDLHYAASWDPSNAEYRYKLGLHYLALQSPSIAVTWLKAATELNPSASKYWVDLALTEQLLGNSEKQNAALQRALAVDPRTPAVAWQAANLFLAEGLNDAAMRQFRTVMENDPTLTFPALTTAWEINPDVEALLQSVVPPSANTPFLQFLLSRKETVAAAKVWDKMFDLQQDVNRSVLLGYEQYLLGRGEVARASRVWQEAAKLCDIGAYQPSSENLLVNGDFSLDVMNGGFDWVHSPVQDVAVALDTTESHTGTRSLRITLDAAGISDAGISQLVVVEPNTRYEFTAFYKAKDMDGAGAMQFAVHDAYQGTPLFMSDDLRNADFWKNAGGTFVTPSDTHLIRVHVVRVPAGRPIRGKLWIDGLRLVQSGGESK